jgi:hypothetical protein
MRAFCVAGVLAGALCWAPIPSQATTLKAFSLEQLAARSDAVVRGRVGPSQGVWKDRVIHTMTEVAVSQVLRGNAPATVVVAQLGGRVGNDWMPVAGVAPLEPGEDVVLFLRAQPDGTWVLCGMSQGKLAVETPGTLRWSPTAPLWTGSTLVEPSSRAVTMDALRRALEAP